MKKLYLLIVTLIFFFPFDIKAIEINEATIIGKENITVGESFTESILISFNELEKNVNQTKGILYLKYEIVFDSEVLSVISIESPDWDTIIYQEADKYYVLSIVNTENRYQNNCFNSFLYCGDYRATIEFNPNKTDNSASLITIKNFELALLDIFNITEYTLDDITYKKTTTNVNYNLTINQSSTVADVITEEDITVDISPENLEEKILNALMQEPIITTESSNLLSDLKISGYDLEFNKYKNNYTISIPENETKLNISVTTEDSQATYKIIGNENINTEHTQVTIEVTSTDNNKNIYVINVEKPTSYNLDLITSNQKLTLKEIVNKYQKQLIYAGIILGTFIIIIIIIKIVSKIKDKKIEDMTNKF